VAPEIIKFDEFELDLSRYELRRRGRPLKLEKVPMELLILLVQRGGELVTREEIVQRLWGEDVFVDTRQGINTAVRKIRIALRDDPEDPRIVQTVVGKGYRLVTPLNVAGDAAPGPNAAAVTGPSDRDPDDVSTPSVLESSPVPAEPTRSRTAGLIHPKFARGLFLLIQTGYLVLYGAAFMHFGGIRRLGLPSAVPVATLVTGLVGAAVRLYLLSAVATGYAGSGKLFRQMFPGILLLDSLWAASPLLLYQRLGELTLLFMAALAFLPFSQRTLMLSAYDLQSGVH
jgi:cholera toxin transcriptional activator